ncbi:MAG: ABC transporter permease [bacterium]|nr:ABC transporter permease [bacterium]
MRTIWLVIKHDLGAILSQPIFWALSLILPALLIGMNAYAIVLNNRPASATQTVNDESAETDSRQNVLQIGLVDDADIIHKWPTDIPADMFIPFDDVTSARAALEAEEIEQYVHIPADYVTGGEMMIYDMNFMIRKNGEEMGVAFDSQNEWMLQYLIDANLVEDESLLTVLGNPVPSATVKWHALNPPPEINRDNRALAEMVSRVIPYIFYFILLIGSSYLMRSVVAEKENRTVEVLLLSVPPRQLMVGKIAAISVVVLIQMGIWMVGGLFIIDRGAEMMNMAAFTFPPGFVVWVVLYLMLGYLLYASIMAAVGALANSASEAGQMMFLLILPLLPTMFGEMFASEPNHWFTLALSLFPLSAPSAMVTRLALGMVPLWQNLLGLAGLAGTTYLFISLAARFFRSDNLLSGAVFKPKHLLTGWRGGG